MEKLFNRFRKENSLTDGEKDLLNQKVYGQINFEEKGSNFLTSS